MFIITEHKLIVDSILLQGHLVDSLRHLNRQVEQNPWPHRVERRSEPRG